MKTESTEPVILISACLAGCRARYDGTAFEVRDARLVHWLAKGLLLPFCPETAGGLSVPRPPAEIEGGGGEAVLAGRACVATRTGNDVTADFINGARLALAAVRHFQLRAAILKEGSPSCGVSRIYDGRFRGHRVPGQGVAAALLAFNRVPLFSEVDINGLEKQVQRMVQGKRLKSEGLR